MGIGPTQHDANIGVLWVALLASFILHVPVALWATSFEVGEEVFTSTTFDAANELTVTVLEEEEEKDKEKEKDSAEEKLQYVSFEAPEKEETPEDAKYLDQFESKTSVEMVRKAIPGSPLRPSSEAPSPRKAPKKAVEPQPEPPTEVEETKPDKEMSEDDAVQAEGELPRSTSPPAKKKAADAQAESGGNIDPKSLFPTVKNTPFVNPHGEGGSLDYLRDVAEGEKTLLNRKRSRYWAFFDRVKLQIGKEWSPRTEYRRRDPYGNVYGVRDRYSAVRVTLNGDGTVRQLMVSRESGLDFYDDEAIRSIRAAAPFHNPPEGIKGEDGLVYFTFGFYFEITSGTSMRVFF